MTDAAESFIRAAFDGDAPSVLRMLSAGVDINAQGRGIWNALHAAIENEQLECVELLVSRGADLKQVNSGLSPLAHAIDIAVDGTWQTDGHPGDEPTDIVQCLLRAGADPQLELASVKSYDHPSEKLTRVLEAAVANLPATTPAPQDQPWFPAADWIARHEALVAARPARVDLLFVGDSITEGWLTDGRAAWDRAFAPLYPYNLGIGGDETAHVLWRLDHGAVDGLAPKLVVLLIGTNNLGNVGHTPQQTAAGVAAVVAKLRAKLPASPVLLLAVFPRDREAGDPYRLAVDDLNALIAPLADGRHVHWLDVGPLFVQPDGTIARSTMPDSLHLTPAAYQTWADAMRPTVERLMGD